MGNRATEFVPPLDIRICHLRSFLSLAETLSFGRSARELYITQPTLSVQIKTLEDAFQVSLFDRSRRGVAITAAGRHLVPVARQVLRELDSLVSEVQETKADIALRLCASQVGQYIALPHILRASSQDHQGPRIELISMVPEKRLAALRNREVDALLLVPEMPDSDVVFHTIGRELMLALVPDRPPFTAMSDISIRDFAKQVILVPSQEECSHCKASTLRIFESRGLSPRLMTAPIAMQAQMAIVAGGKACAFASTSSVGLTFPGVKRLAFQEEIPAVALGILVRNEEHPPAVSWLLSLLQSGSSTDFIPDLVSGVFPIH